MVCVSITLRALSVKHVAYISINACGNIRVDVTQALLHEPGIVLE